MRAKGAFDAASVDLARACPPLRRPQHDRRPARRLGDVIGACGASLTLDVADAFIADVQQRGELPVDDHRLVPAQDVRVISIAREQLADLIVRHPAEHRGPADLVAVEMQDREDGAVASRVEEARAFPRSLERSRLGLSVAHDRGDDEIRIVECRTERMSEDVAELSALVNRSGRGNADMARNAARRRELPEQATQACDVARHVGVDLAVSSLEIHIGDQRRAAVSRSGKVDDVCIALDDEPVEMYVEKTQSGRCAPMPEQTRFDVLGAQWLAEQWVVLKEDLSDRQVIRGRPVAVHPLQ